MALLAFVAGLTWFGHGGRLTFAVMTLLFITTAAVMIIHGFVHPSLAHGRAPVTGPQGAAPIAVLLSFPVAMALATGTEAPATAIGQLGQLGAGDRRRFARATLTLTLLIVAALTIAITALAVRLRVGIPARDSTQIADIASAASGKGALYAVFQAGSALLLPRRPARPSRPAPACSRRCRGIPQARASGSCPGAWARQTATTRRTGRSSCT